MVYADEVKFEGSGRPVEARIFDKNNPPIPEPARCLSVRFGPHEIKYMDIGPLPRWQEKLVRDMEHKIKVLQSELSDLRLRQFAWSDFELSLEAYLQEKKEYEKNPHFWQKKPSFLDELSHRLGTVIE